MSIFPLRDELERLDHRRTRLQEILAQETVSEELQAHIRRSLGEIDRRMSELRSQQAASHGRRAA